MQTSRRVISAIAALCFFVLCNSFIIFALEPYGSRVVAKWDDFYAAENVDTVLMGNSLIEVGVVPTVLDEQLGTSSCNLGSSQQNMDESFIGLRTAIRNQDVKMVVLSVEPAYLQVGDYGNPGKPFIRAKNRYDSPVVVAEDAASFLANWDLLCRPNSINWLFPYVQSHVPLTIEMICRNMEFKINHRLTPCEVACEESHLNHYLGQGYIGSNNVFNFNEDDQSTYRNTFGEGKKLNPRNMSIFEAICSMCESSRVELVVIIPPLARFNALDYGNEWFELTATIRDVVESHGGAFYDCNLLRTDKFSFDDSYFYNNQHLNVEGAAAFTKVLADVISTQHNGGDLEAFFYSPDEYVRSFDSVSFVQLTLMKNSDEYNLTAKSLVDPNLEVEYEFLARKTGSEEWSIIREYGTDAHCIYAPSEKGSYDLRVNARVKGSPAEYEHYRLLEAK